MRIARGWGRGRENAPLSSEGLQAFLVDCITLAIMYCVVYKKMPCTLHAEISEKWSAFDPSGLERAAKAVRELDASRE